MHEPQVVPQIQSKDPETEAPLPLHWQKVQSAIWLIGLAILFWRGWWFPGILVLMALSGLVQALIVGFVVPRSQEAVEPLAAAALESRRAAALPANCPSCGGALEAGRITWRSATVAICPWCSGSVPVTLEAGTTSPRTSA